MKLTSLVKQITRHGAVYGSGELAGRVAGFLLIPLYTAVLVPADFGRLQILLSLHQLGQMTADLGLTGAFLRWFGLAGKEDDRRQIATNVSAMTVFTSLGFTLLVVAVAGSVSRLVFTTADYAPYIRLVGISVGLRVVATLALTYLRLRERPGAYAAFSLGRTLLSLSLVLYFVLARHQGVWGVMLGETIANVAGLLVAAIVLRRTLRPRIRWGDIPPYIKFSLPFLVSNLGAFGLLATDKFLLSAFGFADETGFYSLGGKLGLALNVVIIWPFTLVWNPTVLKIARDETPAEARRLMSKVCTYLTGLLLWAGLALALLAPEVIDVISPRAYAPAVTVAPFLIGSYIVFGLYRHFQSGLWVSGKSHVLATSFVTAATLNLGLNLVLIPRWGMIGAAAATLVSYVVMTGLVLRGTQKHYTVPYEWTRLGGMALLALVLGLGGRLVLATTGVVWPETALKLAVIAAFPVGIVMMKILTRGERQAIRRLLQRVAVSRGAPPRSGEEP